MAQLVGIGIDIDGKTIKQFSSFSLSQAIFDHHTFRLVCPAESIDGTSGDIFNSSKNMIGGAITVQIDSVKSAGTLQFSGVITQVEAARYSGHAGDIIINGFSPTILLDNGPHCKSWEKKAIKNIAQDVLKHFPQNLLQPKISPSYSETLSYTVQYKETAWQFLTRLSSNYGEWLYFDGQKLILGAPQGNNAKLFYGKNLDRFNMALEVRPANFQLMAYDYMNHEVYDGRPASIASKAGLNELGKHALQKSEQFYGTQPKQWHNHFLTNKKQLDDYVNTRASMQSSNLVRFHGSSGHPGVRVGGAVTVEGKNVFNQSDESFGDYTVVSVNHYCDGQGNYNNDFVAIPSGIKMPPVPMYKEARSETQSALVTDNHDPNGLGRVRVKFHWMNGSEKSPWLRVTTPHAGGGKGMFIMPEIGEEVIVGFEGDSPTKPYIIGSVYHGKAKNEFSNGGNDVKAFQSRSGNKVLLNDKDGSVFVSDAKGNSLMIDGKGNIAVKSSETIKLECGDSKIELKQDGTIEILGKKFVKIKSTQQVSVLSDQNTYVKGATKLGLMSDAKIETSSPQIEESAIASFKLSSPMVQIEGQAMTDIKGGIVQLNCG